MRIGVRKDYLKGSRRHGRGHSPYPFDRFLISRLGCRWDDVYSELCSEFDNRSWAGYSFRRDLAWHVKTSCYIGAETGNIYAEDGWNFRVSNEFYVHPWTGLLCWADPVVREKDEKPVEKITLGEGVWLHKEEGIWYRYTTLTHFDHWKTQHDYGTMSIFRRVLDHVCGGTCIRVPVYREEVVKNQLKRKELRTRGLANAGKPYGKRCAVCGFDGRCVHAIRKSA